MREPNNTLLHNVAIRTCPPGDGWTGLGDIGDLSVRSGQAPTRTKPLLHTFFFILFLIGFCEKSSAQPVTLWTRTYGFDDFDVGTDIEQTFDGGFIVSSGRGSAWLLRTDEWGDTLWTRVYDRDGFGSQAQQLIQTADGGIAIAARLCTMSDCDIWLIRTDENGDTLWTELYGGIDTEFINSFEGTSDAGFIFTGSTYSFGAGSRDVWVVKTDFFFEQEWMKTYGGVGRDSGYQIRETSDGGFVLIAAMESEVNGLETWVIRIDKDGNDLWDRNYGELNAEWSGAVRQTADGGFIIASQFDGAGITIEDEILIIKTDALGDTLWTRPYGRSISDQVSDIEVMEDGGFLMLGVTRPFGFEPFDYLLVRMDSVGATLWTKLMGGPGHELYPSFERTSDGGIVITGLLSKAEDLDDQDIWIVRLGEPKGRVVAGEVAAEPGDTVNVPLIVTLPVELEQYSAAVYLSGYGGELEFFGLDTARTMIGKSGWKYEIIQMNDIILISANGSVPISGEDTLTFLKFYVSKTDSGFIPIIVDSARFNESSMPVDVQAGGVDVYIRTGIEPEELLPSYFLGDNYPNPFNPSTRIEFTIQKSGFTRLIIYDLLGREVSTLVNDDLDAGLHSATWEAGDASSGIYFYKLTSGDFIQTKKMLFLK